MASYSYPYPTPGYDQRRSSGPFGTVYLGPKRGRRGRLLVEIRRSSNAWRAGSFTVVRGIHATMDRVFAMLVAKAGQSLVEAAILCATTPARELGLTGQGVIVPGSLADLVVLTPDLQVVQTWVGGRTRTPPAP